MARQPREGLLGIHVNMPADTAKAVNDGDPAPAGLTTVEKAGAIASRWLPARKL
jgi:hypothetical protein